MIERKIINAKFNNYTLESFIRKVIFDVPIKEILLEKTPIGERITIHTSAPGLVIGRQGSNIKKLTKSLKDEFNFENPQVKIAEITQPFLSAQIVSRMMANDLARFGSQKFKLTGFKALMNIMNAGAMGVEIRITGKLPSSRSKSWRFVKGYLKKTGYVSDFLVDHAIEKVTLKTGVVGIQVSIMLPDTPLPDKIIYVEDIVSKENLEKVIEKKSEVKADGDSKDEVSMEKKPEEVKE